MFSTSHQDCRHLSHFRPLIPSSLDGLEARLREARTSGRPSPELVDALNEVAWAVRQKDPQRCLRLAREAAGIARGLGHAVGLGWALRNSGHAHYRLADYGASLRDSQEALEVFERLGDDSGRASALGSIGMAHTRLADYQQGLRYHRESLGLRRAMGDAVGEGASLNNLGVIHFELADYPAALEHYLASLAIWQRLEHRDGAGHALNNLGEVHEKMGDLERALECYEQACVAFEEVGNEVGAGATRVNRGRVLLDRGEPEAALAALEACLARARQTGDRWNEGICEPLIGRALLELGRTTEAEAHFESGLETLAALGLRYPEAEALLFLARLRLDHGWFHEAAQLLHRTLRIARETGSNALRYRAHHHLAELHEARGRPRLALRHHRLYDRRMTTLLVRAEAAEVEREAEIHRLRHVELARLVAELEEANAQLADANARLEQANQEKEELLVQLARRARELDRMARGDALTGVANRRQMSERLVAEYVRALRFERPLAAVMVDADGFKQANDRFSHAVGDEVLRRLARILVESCRAVDVVGRWGGEEFLVLLVEARYEAAARVCEKIRRAVEGYAWDPIAPGLSVTVSLGFATLTSQTASAEALVGAADAELYRAKRAGRNRVSGAGEAAP